MQTWQYDAKDKEVYYELTVNGSTSGIRRSFYNDKEDLDSVHYISNSELKRHIYSYDKGVLVGIKTYDESNNLLQMSKQSYHGLSTVMETFNAFDELLFTIYIQTNSKGQEVDWKQVEANGTVSIHRVTVYDEKGNVIKVTDKYDGSGTYEYITTWSCE